jgi:hypothetical protein
VVRVGAKGAQEGFGGGGVFGPDRPMSYVVGGLWTAGGITHVRHRRAGVLARGAGESVTECLGWIDVPAEVGDREVEHVGPFG